MANAFANQLARINTACLESFSEVVRYQPRSNNADSGDYVEFNAIPLDPLRLENATPGQFIVYWFRRSDLVRAGITPRPLDHIVIDPSDTAVIFAIHQVQEDVGGGVRLILLKVPV